MDAELAVTAQKCQLTVALSCMTGLHCDLDCQQLVGGGHHACKCTAALHHLWSASGHASLQLQAALLTCTNDHGVLQPCRAAFVRKQLQPIKHHEQPSCVLACGSLKRQMQPQPQPCAS